MSKLTPINKSRSIPLYDQCLQIPLYDLLLYLEYLSQSESKLFEIEDYAYFASCVEELDLKTYVLANLRNRRFEILVKLSLY